MNSIKYYSGCAVGKKWGKLGNALLVGEGLVRGEVFKGDSYKITFRFTFLLLFGNFLDLFEQHVPLSFQLDL